MNKSQSKAKKNNNLFMEANTYPKTSNMVINPVTDVSALLREQDLTGEVMWK